jgi:hypothetical protein
MLLAIMDVLLTTWVSAAQNAAVSNNLLSSNNSSVCLVARPARLQEPLYEWSSLYEEN